MMTSSNGNIFRVTGLLCGEFTGHRWIPPTKASDAELSCFFDLRLDKRLNKQLRRRWFETPSHSLWRHCTAYIQFHTPAAWYSGTPLERPGMSKKSCEIWCISMHHSLQIMFILPLMTGHLFWKATVLGGLNRGVPLYFNDSLANSVQQ